MKKCTFLVVLALICCSVNAFAEDEFYVIPTVKTVTETVTETVTKSISLRTITYQTTEHVAKNTWTTLIYSLFPNYSRGYSTYLGASVVAASDSKQGVKLRYYYKITEDGQRITVYVWEDDSDNFEIIVMLPFMILVESTS